MSKKLSDLALQAQNLPLEERIELVELILDGLAPPDNEVELAWGQEAQQRLEKLRRGEAETFDADAVLADARASLQKSSLRRQRS